MLCGLGVFEATGAVECAPAGWRCLTELAEDLTDTDCPPELRSLGRTLGRWHQAIVNWYRA